MAQLIVKFKYVLIIFLVISLASLLYFYYYPKTSVTGQLLGQELALAKSEAQNIQSFIEGMGGDLVSVSQQKDIINPGIGTKAVLKSFVDRWGKNKLITGISITNKDGVVIYNYSDLCPIETGASLSDRDYFIWAKDQQNSKGFIVGSSVIAKFGINKGKYITPLAVPIFKDGVFSGIVASAIRTAELTDYFLGTMNVSKNTDAYLLGKDGYVLFNSNNPKDMVININEATIKNLFLDNKDLNTKIYTALSRERQGGIVAGYLDPVSGKSEMHAIAYSPVVMPGRHWLVILSSPATEITKVSIPAYVRQLSLLLLLALTLFTVLSVQRGRKS